MARKKVKLAWISNDAARRATFKKRKKGLLKKTSELSILCGSDACAIVYGPYDLQPEMWPDDVERVTKVLNRFRRMPEAEKTRKMMNQEGNYFRDGVEKVKLQLKRMIKKDGYDLEMTGLLCDCLRGRELFDLVNITMVTDLLGLLGKKIELVSERLRNLQQPPVLVSHGDVAGDQDCAVVMTSTTAPSGRPILSWMPTWSSSSAMPSDIGGGGHDELLVYPPQLLPAPEDISHSYVHPISITK